MRPENSLLFTCTRQTFLPAHEQRVLDIARHSPLNWDSIYSIALAHGVAPLVYKNLQQCANLEFSLPKEVLSKFQGSFFHNMASKEGKAEMLRKTLAFFAEKSIDVMLIKGVALDILVYDHPYYTMPKDVDIILKTRREDLSSKEGKQIDDHLYGLGVEYDYFAHHDTMMNGILPVNFCQLWEAASKINFRGQAAFVMAPEDMLLTVCINSCRKRFFKLKSLCDIAEIIDKYPDLNWEKVAGRAKAFDCHNIVYTALLVTKMTLGCQLPEAFLETLKVSPARAAIIRSLARHLSHNILLSALYPFSGRRLFGRDVNGVLLLSYATYQWHQVWRKMREINGAWRLPD